MRSLQFPIVSYRVLIIRWNIKTAHRNNRNETHQGIARRNVGDWSFLKTWIPSVNGNTMGWDNVWMEISDKSMWQGSVLRPVIFIIFINDMCKYMTVFILFHNFALQKPCYKAMLMLPFHKPHWIICSVECPRQHWYSMRMNRVSFKLMLPAAGLWCLPPVAFLKQVLVS